MNSLHSRSSVLSLVLFTVFISASVRSQQSHGSISGEVRDAVTQQPLPMANILLVGTTLGAVSNDEGYYVVKQIPPGVYQVRVSIVGYEAAVLSEVFVAPKRNKAVDIVLRPAAIELEGVSVRADRFLQPLDNAVSYRSLEPEEIRRSPGSAEDIFRVIQSMPGVAAASGKSAQLIVRGGSPDENLTLLDNIEIYNPIHFARSGASVGVISIINPSLLRQVDFMTGGFPVKYGDKMSSVFEMSLQDGNKEMLNTDMNLSIAGFGVTLDGPIARGASGILSLRRGFFDLATSIMNKPVSPQYYDAVGKVNYDLNARNRMSIVGFYYIDMVKREGEQGILQNNKYDYVTRDDYGSALGINWRSLISDNSILITTISVTDNGWNTKMGFSYNPSLRTEDISEREVALKSELAIQLSPAVEVKAGFAAKAINADDNQTIPADTTRTGKIIPGFSRLFILSDALKFAGFAQGSFHPVTALTLTGGLRFDRYQFTGESIFSPRLGARYGLTADISLIASAGIFYQTPMPYEIAADPLNTHLRSTRAVHYVIGVERRLNDETRASLEYFYKDLSNVSTGADSNRVLTNAGSGYAQGIELSLQKKLSDGFVGSFSYSYSTSMRRDLPSEPMYAFEYDRPHIVNVIGGYEFGQGWILGVKFSYASGAPYTPPAGIDSRYGSYYIVDGDRNAARYPEIHRLDIRIDKRFTFTSWTLTAYLDLWNVYDRANVISYDFSVDENQNIRREEKLDFGFLPIIGLTAQF